MKEQRVREFGGDFDAGANRPYESPQNQGLWPSGAYFRSGRDALKAVAQFAKKRGARRAWLPALCCPSMVFPFESRGLEVSYYRLCPSLRADDRELGERLADGDVLLYMDYFANQSFAPDTLQELAQRYPRLITVEDRTHDLLCGRNEGYQPDFVIASLRKWAALPDGGGLWTGRELGPSFEDGDDLFSRERASAQREKEVYLATGEPKRKAAFLESYKRAERFLDADRAMLPMTASSRNTLERLDFEKIADRRTSNARTLLEELRDTDIPCLLPHGFCAPLYFPILVEEQERTQRELAAADLYCPVIWKIPQAAEKICPVSTRISRRMLAVPCDQRYTRQDMRAIAAMLRTVLGR